MTALARDKGTHSTTNMSSALHTQLKEEPVEQLLYHMGGKTLVAMSPDNNDQLITANRNGIVKVLNLEKSEEEPEIVNITQNLSSLVALSQNRFVTTTVTGNAYLYNTNKPDGTLLLRTALPLRDACALNEKTICFASDDLTLMALDLTTDDDGKRAKPEQIVELPDQPLQISCSPQTNILAVSMMKSKIDFYSLSSEKPNLVHRMQDCIPENYYKPFQIDGTTYGSGGSPETEANGDDAEKDSSGDVDDPEYCPENITCTRVAWHPTGLWFAIPTNSGSVTVYSLKNYQKEKVLNKSLFSVNVDLSFDPFNGNYVAVLGKDNGLTVWDWRAEKEIISVHLDCGPVSNLQWRKNGESIEIITGTWTGTITTINTKDILTLNDTKKTSNSEGDKATKSTLNGLFIDSDDDDSDADLLANVNPNVDVMAADEAEAEPENADSDEDLFGDDGKDDNSAKRKYHFDNELDFIDDDDGAGYIERNASGNVVSGKRQKSMTFDGKVSQRPAKFKYRPVSASSTPFGDSDRRYLTMNNIGYVSTVRNNEQFSITVSFFDLGRYNEYHFEDLFGYDVCFLNEHGTLFAQSKTGQVHYRPHDTLHANWTKLIPLSDGEIITSIAATPRRVLIGTSFGYVRSFNEFGLTLNVEKLSPVVLLTAHEYKVFIVHCSVYQEVSYSLFEQSSTKSVYYQRETPLPVTLPQVLSRNKRSIDATYEEYNPTGIKSLFFSLYGDPCVFGCDNVLLVLSKWRSNMESRWLPVLDSDMEVWKMTGGNENSDVHVWPLGLTYDTLNCILVKGKKQWPEFPLPLPSEMEIKIPVLVKSKLLEDHKAKLKAQREERAFDSDLHGPDADAEADDDKEIIIPVNVAAEEEYIRSKVLSSLLTDTIENEGEMFGNENDILGTLVSAFDKALLRLFATACSDQNTDKAFSIARELKQDRALAAAAQISERAEMMTLTKRINDLREARFEQQINNV